MTTFFKYFCLTCLMLPLTSCDEAKDVLHDDPLDSYAILKSHQWAVEDVKMVHRDNIVDLVTEENGIFSFCAQDNLFEFKDGGQIELEENSNICLDAPLIKAYIDGNWTSSNNSDSIMILNSAMVQMFGTMNATSENKIDLDLIYDIDWQGEPYNLKLSLFSVEEE